MIMRLSDYGTFDILNKKMDEIKPYAVISTWLASSAKGIRLETNWKNIMNGKYADNNGKLYDWTKIIEDWEDFLRPNSDVLRLAKALEDKGLPFEISENQEGFICNSLYYLTTKKIIGEELPIKNIFFHIPWTDNYMGKIELEPHKMMISKEILYKTIRLIIENI